MSNPTSNPSIPKASVPVEAILDRLALDDGK